MHNYRKCVTYRMNHTDDDKKDGYTQYTPHNKLDIVAVTRGRALPIDQEWHNMVRHRDQIVIIITKQS